MLNRASLSLSLTPLRHLSGVMNHPQLMSPPGSFKATPGPSGPRSTGLHMSSIWAPLELHLWPACKMCLGDSIPAVRNDPGGWASDQKLTPFGI